MTSNKTEFDDLFLELKIKIFELLGLDDLLKLRLVCKNWKNILSQVKIRELTFDRSNSSEKSTFYHTNILKRNIIKVDDVWKIKKILESPLFNLRHIDRLWINSLNSDFKIELFNKLCPKLVQLEILKCNGCDGKLNLKTLEILCLNTIYNSNLIIDAPKLSVVSCKIGIDQVQFNQPEAVKRLEIYSFKDKVFSFINLEYLKLDHTDQSDNQNFSILNILQKLPKLKEINFSLEEYEDEYYMYTMETIRYLLNDKKRLGKKGMKIHFKDRLMVNDEQIDLLGPSDFFTDIDSDETDSDNESIDSSDFIYDYDGELFESDNSLMGDY